MISFKIKKNKTASLTLLCFIIYIFIGMHVDTRAAVIYNSNAETQTEKVASESDLNSFILYRNKMVLVARDSRNIPIATFSVSCRKNNPDVGEYSINGSKQRWATLFGDETHSKYVYGQYATRIKGHILFHSVCYEKFGNPFTLIPHYYNDIIDEKQSLGCIRMRVIDAKWVYDNVKPGMKIEVKDTKEDITRPKYDYIPGDSKLDPTDIEATLLMFENLKNY